MLLISAIFWLINPEFYLSPVFHLFAGATMLWRVLYCNRPGHSQHDTSRKVNFRCRLRFADLHHPAAGVDILMAVAFAVLLMNLSAPLIDHFSQPRITGYRERKS